MRLICHPQGRPFEAQEVQNDEHDVLDEEEITLVEENKGGLHPGWVQEKLLFVIIYLCL